MANLAGKPEQYVIFNDPTLKGRSSVSSVTSEGGAYPGPVSPGADNLGKMLPLQSGRLTDDAVAVDYLLNAAGGGDAAEFVWRENGASNYLGTDDARRFHQYHMPVPLSSGVGSDNITCAFSTAFRRALGFAINGISLVTIASRDIDTTRYDEWSTLATFTLENEVAGNANNLAAIELIDGTMMLAVRVGDGTTTPANDFDIYHSVDGGATFTLVSQDIIRRFTPDGVFDTHDLTVPIKLAISGEWIRIAFVDTTAVIRDWVSSDRGMTWKSVGGGIVCNDNGDSSNPVAYDIVGADDNGSFLLAYYFGGASLEVPHRPAFQDGPWDPIVSNSDSRISYPAGTEVNAITLCRVPGFVYEFAWYTDKAVSNDDHWRIRRSTPADFQDWTNGYETADAPTEDWGGCFYAWSRPCCIWIGNRMMFMGGRKDVATGIDVIEPACFYTGGWTERSFGDDGPNVPFDSLTTRLMEHAWSTINHRPDVGAGSNWTEVIVGASTRNITQDRLFISPTGSPATRYYEQLITAGTGRAWGFERRFTAGWVLKLDSGDGSQATDICHVRLISSNNAVTSSWAVHVRHGPAGITLRDINAFADLLSIAVDMDSTPYIEVRLTVDIDQTAYLAAFNSGTKAWVVSAVSAAFTLGGAIVNKNIRFGMSAAAALTAGQRWREFWIGDSDMNQQDLIDEGVPDALFGHVAVPGERYYIEHGLHVAWAGAGGALGDTFDGAISHRHPVENIFVDSPRIDWRSGGANPQAANTIIFDAGVDRRFDHEAIALFGTNGREIIIDYDDNVGFASPVGGGTVVPLRFDGSFFTVGSVDGTTITLSDASGSGHANDVFVTGECLGLYVRPGNGTALGLTWKVTRHDRLLVLHFDDEIVDLATQGLAAGNLVELFGDHGQTVFSTPVLQRFMRLRFGVVDTNTAEGDHRLGTIVPGTKLDIDVPMDWSFTDNEQPNVTNHRTRGAVGWSYSEGPDQRTVVGRVVGDVTQRFRDRMRFLQRMIGYEVRPVALVIDDAKFEPMLSKQRAGNQQDNAAWYVDNNGIRRTAGDVSLTFVEEV